jgi:hypothetical protein
MKALILSLCILCFNLFSADYSLPVRGVEKPVPTVTLMGHGRGVAISKTLVISARHVFMNYADTAYRTPEVQVKGKWVVAVVLADDEANDLVLLQFAEPQDVIVADLLVMPDIVTDGSPGLSDAVKRVTTIEHLIVRVDAVKDLQNPGEAGGLSGSPVLAGSNLIGIVSAASRDHKGIIIKCIGPEPIRQLCEPHLKKE